MPCLNQFIFNTVFRLKCATGTFQRQSPAATWVSIAPAINAEEAFALNWKNKSPGLPISFLDRTYLAPHLEKYAVALGCSPEAEAKAIALGRFRTRHGEFISLGILPEWNRGQEEFLEKHWSEIPIAAATAEVAEASYFNWVYALMRAWILSGDDTHVETFWTLFENWLKKNSPNVGPRWVSDAEISTRILAVTFAIQALRFHPGITESRIIKAARFISVSATRLKLTFNYAKAAPDASGRLSALGLFTAGALWPQLSAADSWRSAGLEYLISQGGARNSLAGATPAQILEIYTWSEIILRAESEKESLPESLQEKVRELVVRAQNLPQQATSFSSLFPLSGCGSGDTRPALAAAQILFTGTRFISGEWDEAALLLIGPLCTSKVLL